MGSSSPAISFDSIHLNSVWGYLTELVAALSANQNTSPGLGLAPQNETYWREGLTKLALLLNRVDLLLARRGF
jgi:hypothetical protein